MTNFFVQLVDFHNPCILTVGTEQGRFKHCEPLSQRGYTLYPLSLLLFDMNHHPCTYIISMIFFLLLSFL